MAEIWDVVVVGAGMFGSAAAKYLSRAGAKVLVIGPAEPPDDAPVNRYAFGAHFDVARITRRLGWDEVWGALDAQSLERFRDIEAQSGIGFFYERGSLVLLAKSIEHRTKAILDQCAAENVAVERLSDEELRLEYPELGVLPLTGGTDGLLEREQAGYLDPRQMVKAQLTIAQANGGQLLRAAVTAIWKDGTNNLWQLRVEGDGELRQIQSEKVLVATGAFTNQNSVLPNHHQLALYAFTEPNLLFEIGDGQLDQFWHMPPIVTVDPEDSGDANMSVYMLPPILYPDGRWYIRIGPGMQPLVEELRTADDMVNWHAGQRITVRQKAFLDDMMQMLVPNLKPESVREACCIIEKTPSRYPYIGHIDDDKSFAVAIGGNGHGARGSDEIGRLASTVMMGQPWDSVIPQGIFAPIALPAEIESTHGRPDFLKPPFGLC